MFLSTCVGVHLWRSEDNAMEYALSILPWVQGPNSDAGGKAGTLAAECPSGSGPRLLGSFLGHLFPACGGLGFSVLNTLSGQCCLLRDFSTWCFLVVSDIAHSDSFL